MDLLARAQKLKHLSLGILLILVLAGCQVPYVVNNAYQQFKLFSRREKIEDLLKSEKTDEKTKNKLRLVLEAHEFAETHLGLAKSQNYLKFVQLEGPYVTYVVHAAPKWELTSYQWWFPIVGHVPYKGFFKLEQAQGEAQSLQKENLDTYVRGVSAYSTLGWFDDPLWSSMLAYEDHDLVNTVIHETVHATIYVKSQSEFNEQLATFMGDWGTELFYHAKEGERSATMDTIQKESRDRRIFSDFIALEMKTLRGWYEKENLSMKNENSDERERRRQSRLDEIRDRFQKQVAPRLETPSYSGFGKNRLNNASLLATGTYYEDLADFQRLRSKMAQNFSSALKYLQTLQKSAQPSKDLRDFANSP